MEISDLKIELSINWKGSNITLSVTNIYNSPLTVIGSKVNGSNYGYIDMEIPPGQTQKVNLPLNNLPITNSVAYDTALTFTFDNGQYEKYSSIIIPEKYSGAFMAEHLSVNNTAENTNVFATIKNTGNIPLVSLKCTIGNYTVPDAPSLEYLAPKSSTALSFTVPHIFKAGETTDGIEIEATFAEGSTFSSKTVVNVINLP